MNKTFLSFKVTYKIGVRGLSKERRCNKGVLRLQPVASVTFNTFYELDGNIDGEILINNFKLRTEQLCMCLHVCEDIYM